MAKLTAIATLLLTISVQCHARVYSPLKTDQTESLQYVVNLIDGFGFAKSGYSGVQAESAPTARADITGIISEATVLMLNLKRSSEDYECAATLVEGFSASKNRAIIISAQGSAVAYRRLITLNTEFLTILKDLLNAKPSTQGSLSDKISDNMLQRDKAWEMLLNGTTAATFTLVVVPQTENEKVSELNITQEQRTKLNAKLEQIFGDTLKKDVKDIEISPDASGWLLYEFMNRKDWKVLPSK
jgi:hypothetical protein